MTTARIAGDSVIEWIPLNQLIIEPSAQRPYDVNEARAKADNLNLNLLGVIQVSVRPDGSMAIMDGQHRVGALRLAGYTTELVRCEVSRDLDTAGEAGRFLGLNDYRLVRAIDKFKVSVTAGEPAAVGVTDILERHGWKVATGTSDGYFMAVNAALNVYIGRGNRDKSTGPADLEHVIEAVTLAWGRKPSGVSTYIVGGLGMFFSRYGEQVDRHALERRLAQLPGGPDGLLGKARGIREFRGGTLPRCVAEAVTVTYNSRRSSGRLEDFR